MFELYSYGEMVPADKIPSVRIISFFVDFTPK